MDNVTVSEQTKEKLRRFAARIRVETLRAMSAFGAGHVGGAMSCADILAVLYGETMNITPSEPDRIDRDIFVMSKGHCGPALYATLALSGYFPLSWLETLNRPETRLPSHCDRLKTPGVDATTGSLGQGVSIADGMALGIRWDNLNSMVYVLLGDGELQEGQVWEAAEFASRRKLSNMVWLIDVNKMQLDGYTKDIGGSENLKDKFISFGFSVSEVNGHDVEQIRRVLNDRKGSHSDGKPFALLLNTVKGGGCLFAERAELCHHMNITERMLKEAEKEIIRRLENGLLPAGDCYD